MKAIVKDIYFLDYDGSLENFQPKSPKSFGFTLELKIGFEGEKGTNDFSIFVCTPDWLEVMLRYEWGRIYWGRHMLLVLEFDFELIKKQIFEYVEKCEGKDVLEVVHKISRVAAWEFEGYES